jgi:hypothetical protein
MLQFANPTERIYMIAGTTSAALAGIVFPFFLMFFGEITNIFTEINNAS